MALANKQKEAIKKFVDLIAVAPSGDFEFAIRTEPMAILFDRLLKARPWSDMFDQWELTVLVKRLITRFERREEIKGYVGAMGDMQDKKVAQEITDALIEYFDSLPRPYFVCFQVSRFPRLGQAEVQLLEDVSLIDTGSTFHDGLVSKPVGARVAANGLRYDTVYLRFRLKGYASASADSDVVSRAIAKLKHFLFLGMEARALESKGLVDLYLQRADTQPMFADCLIYHADQLLKESFRVHLPD